MKLYFSALRLYYVSFRKDKEISLVPGFYCEVGTFLPFVYDGCWSVATLSATSNRCFSRLVVNDFVAVLLSFHVLCR